MSGRLIVIDGLDGSGKTTQLERLEQHLKQQQKPCRFIQFPDYEQPSSTLVKMYLAGEFGTEADAVNAYAASSFYAVDRYASYRKFWEQDYKDGRLIVAARYTTSNAIHQMSKLPREEWDAYLAWLEHYEYTLLGLPRPDRTVFLDMPTEVSRRLLAHRYEGDEDKKDIHERDDLYREHCREAALYAAKVLGWTVVPCADGTEALPLERITESLLELMKEDEL